jgi:hypothetical protein
MPDKQGDARARVLPEQMLDLVAGQAPAPVLEAAHHSRDGLAVFGGRRQHGQAHAVQAQSGFDHGRPVHRTRACRR